MAKKKDRMTSVEKGDFDLKTDDDDLSVLFTSAETEDEAYTSSPEESVTPPLVTRRPRTRLGRVWAFFRDTPPLRIIQMAGSIVVTILMAIFVVHATVFMFTPVGYIVSLCVGFIASVVSVVLAKKDGLMP
ncbi:MAG: hypothetical protein Q8Q12_17220 [bacterium]|nr:hypothetical protein [bacterium]